MHTLSDSKPSDLEAVSAARLKRKMAMWEWLKREHPKAAAFATEWATMNGSPMPSPIKNRKKHEQQQRKAEEALEALRRGRVFSRSGILSLYLDVNGTRIHVNTLKALRDRRLARLARDDGGVWWEAIK